MKKIITITLCNLTLITSALFAMHAPGTPLSQITFGRAGVLPVTQFQKPDPCNPRKKKWVKYVVLAREARGPDKNAYDAFAGRREKGQVPVQTAAMEFWEEGILYDTLSWNRAKTEAYIDLRAGNTELVLVTEKSVLYITNFSTKDVNRWRTAFYPALNRARQPKFTEKDRIAVVRWDELKNSIRNAPKETDVKLMARVTDPKTKKDRKHREVITLRPILVKELRGYFKGWKYNTGKNPKIRYY